MEDIPEKFNGILMEQEQNDRNRDIVKVSIVGIVANILLAVFKAIVGVIAGSIAITLDAVNNISDAASSIITIVGTKLANKAPDKKHPFGHGRIEYLTAMIIAIIVSYAGITSLVESIKKIFNPDIPDYSAISLIIVGVAIVVKIVLGRYVKKAGERLNSSSLINSGNDATLDSVISASTLLAAIIFLTTKISLEAYLGAIISIIIIKSGIDMLKEAISSVLGERADYDIISDINKTIHSFEDVKGVYDLVLNNYGPNYYTGSVHIEIEDTLTADKIDELLRKITEKVYLETKVLLTAIGIYSINTKNEKVIKIKNQIQEVLKNYKHVLQFHGLYIEEKTKTIRFDIVIDFDEKDRVGLYNKIYEEVSNLFTDYKVIIIMDVDFCVSM